METKKVVLKLSVYDEKCKQKAMQIVSSLPGVDSLNMNMKDKKLTITGDVDPVKIVSKLKKKICFTEIVSVGPAKEPEKKKEEPKKPEEKKDPKDQVSDLVKAYQAYNPHLTTYYHVTSAEENPNSCVIS